MILDKLMQQSGRLAIDRSVIARIRAGNCGLDQAKTDYAFNTSIAQSFVMSCNHVSQSDNVVAHISGQPNALKLPCVLQKFF